MMYAHAAVCTHGLNGLAASWADYSRGRDLARVSFRIIVKGGQK